MKLIDRFTYEQAEEVLRLLDDPVLSEMSGLLAEGIAKQLDNPDAIWSSPADMIRWLYGAKEAWK